eukprot:Plantae.Rhodophyta-Purpureofilum_apyrenoidigerum.ctg8636.p1 GENE.Plantae.Rhodophyta-Purpureofilum_apyrenoidigerum.ctg8636~~Plantae.Rhodophyta-Purpureofilum_apyrenoidigerum.ctg8636.p1  ORF type:complete len:489 (-),score=91.08 Plantae.Rhodophyta-Purpureofilum_apyrenoidigerum.ctg8636:400-1713(-)
MGSDGSLNFAMREMFANFAVQQDIAHGEQAPDSEVSVIKVAKEVLGGVKNGADVTNIVLPASVLDPVSSLEKGMKAMQRGEMLPHIVKAQTPEERFFRVMTWYFSGLPKEKFGKKPYNPILGEVFRCKFQHADPQDGATYLACEQVSHHPPIAALHLNNPTLGFEMNSMNRPEPRFYGNYIELKLHGIIRLYLHDFDEEYHITRPTIYQCGILGIGNKRVEFVGTSYFCCEKSNLLATIDFKGKGFLGMSGTQHAVSGSIKTLDTDELLYEIEGVWDQIVYATNVKTKQKSVLFDYEAAKAASMTVWLPEEKNLEPNNSLIVWKKCSEAIWKQDARGANDEKKAVEEAQRQLRKQREEKNEAWEPVLFHPHPCGSGYVLKDSLVPLIPNARSRVNLPTGVSPLSSRLENSTHPSPRIAQEAHNFGKRMGKLFRGGLK